MNRYEAIQAILQTVGPDDAVLSTTGMISREVHMSADRAGNFYMIGSMGLLSAMGLGMAILNPNLKVYVLDGDGSALMSLGTTALIAAEAPSNLVHIVLDNESYESTGAQPSISSHVSLAAIARAAGYAHVVEASNQEDLRAALDSCASCAGPHLLLAKVGIAPVPGIPRIALAPVEIRDRFAKHVRPRTA